MKKLSTSLALVLFFGILLFLGGCNMWTFNPTKTYNNAKDMEQPYDAIIVPGVPFENGKWSDIMKARVYWSYYLYQQGVTKNIIYSGSAVYSPYVESEIMAMYAKELGIPEENIFTESRAEHSTENLYYSYHLGKEKGFTRIALATDPFQTFMLTSTIKTKLHHKVGIVPIVFPTIQKMDKRDPEIQANKAFVENFTSIEERENPVKRFMGTLGLQIDYKADQARKRKNAKKARTTSMSKK